MSFETDLYWDDALDFMDKNPLKLSPAERYKRNLYNSMIDEQLKIKEIEKMSEKNGIYNNKLSEKTPDWIICKIGIKVDELPKPNNKGFINIDICRSQDGSYYYPKLNEYGLNKEEDKSENIVEFIDNTELPF